VSGLDQLQYLSWLLFLVVFVAVLDRTIRRPTPAHLDMTLFFGAVAILIVVSTVTAKLHVPPPPWVTDLSGAAALSLGYLLLRLVRDFSDVPALAMRAVEVGLVASVLAIILLPAPLPNSTALLLVAYLVLVIAYDTLAFARQASRTHGVTRRRMQAAAAGSLSLTLALVVAGFGLGLADFAGLWEELGALLGLASGACYFIAFAPPTWLRHAWQEPELRAFLAGAASLPRLPDLRSIVRELERGAAAALGAPAASIALWDPDTRHLHGYYPPTPLDVPSEQASADVGDGSSGDGAWDLDPAAQAVIARAFVRQRPTLITDLARTDPANAALFRRYNARTLLSAPITASTKRLGLLLVYAPRAPVFANSDLELVQLLADQAAVILESRALIDEAARVAAREEAARLKEDFLSSAAHDLKTPLTGIVTQAQLLRRRAARDPGAPADVAGLNRLVEQSQRLKDLVIELLDVSRLEQGGLVGERAELDLRTLVQAAANRDAVSGGRRLEIDGPPEPVMVAVDAPRFDQVLTNLIENALKYSPHDSPVVVRVWQTDDEARLSVQDRGIGVPIEDQPLVFERFHRAKNVDDRRFAGMGLGLYIARGIVEQHGGRIWLDSTPGAGSTFFVALPAVAAGSGDTISTEKMRVTRA
jgi:signal transduction histidine kinase